ncbi:peptide methionine sulfoxide reductase msrA 2 [Staphylococcus aureus M0407]|nr:peptide methionine sulfoxide reductase msrA 2 [Staphylococcus aureus M0407]EVM20880.1 peptide methionine sulfoxide reductase msrA 2 [Staphylococcus aureus M0905]
MTKEYATLAGGCFWCMVKPFTSYPGIKSVVSGYSGGTLLMNRYVRIKPAMSKQYKLRLIQRLLPLKIY